MRRRLSYANVAATLALVFAMSGGALAANHYLINSTKQINPKVLKKLKGAAGKAGAKGANGGTGAAGAAGAAGAPGKEGPRGPGIVAFHDDGKEFQTCTLESGATTCFASPSNAFTPSVNATCSVTISSQISTNTPLKPTIDGPYFRIQVKEGGSSENDGAHGQYFEGTPSEQSTSQDRTRLIPVKAGTTYEFGAYFGSSSGEWVGKSANFRTVYVCYA